MAVRKPIVRHFIACDRVESSSGGSKVTLVNIIYAIRLLPGAAYPHVHPELWLFAQVSDAQGAFTLTVELRFLDDDTLIFPPVSKIVDFGQDPLAVRGLPIQIRKIRFRQPGLYEFRLLCDGEIIAREPAVVR